MNSLLLKIHMKLKQIFFLTAIVLVTFASCKKTDPTPVPVPPPGTPTRAELTKDSIFLYAKQLYLWNDALPTYDAFKPRGYTAKSTDLLNYEAELLAIANSAKNPATNLGYEYYANGTDTKYSYISDIADKNPVAYIPNKTSAVDLEGNGNDFGLKISAYGQDDIGQEYVLYVTAVYQNSPADKAGMIRSHKILKINDKTIGASYPNERDLINTAFNATTIKLEGVTYVNGIANAPFTVNLTKASYKSSPVYAAKVFTAGAKKIGYLAYARFSKLSNPSNVNPSDVNLDPIFVDFASKGVTDLIVDLRYNGGGYVSTAQYLIDQIAPITLNKKLMYTETYNSLMQSNGASILKNQPFTINDVIQYNNGKMITLADLDYSVATNTEFFQKNGPLTGVTKVVFIVSGNTASASELVINSLKPYITVKMVGTQTYGKPVGFFPIRLENKYDVYYSLFQTKNSLGQGDYYNGFTPDVPFTDVRGDLDDPRNNFGDPQEYYTSVALKEFGATGPITIAAAKTMSINGKNVSVQSLKPMKPIVDGNEFVGMIETNHRIKK